MTAGKRFLDLILAIPVLVLLSPLLLLAALAIRIDSPGPSFFRQERIGRGGRPFRIWKFRTMVADAERRGAQLTVGRDPRITGMGLLLRASKLDELPQLINVLRGDMSLVGPRPEVARYVSLYTREQRRVLVLTPGITDPASIVYRREAECLAACADPERTYLEEIVPDKIRLNLEYASGATIWSDVAVITRTLSSLVLRGDHRPSSG